MEKKQTLKWVRFGNEPISSRMERKKRMRVLGCRDSYRWILDTFRSRDIVELESDKICRIQDLSDLSEEH